MRAGDEQDRNVALAAYDRKVRAEGVTLDQRHHRDLGFQDGWQARIEHERTQHGDDGVWCVTAECAEQQCGGVAAGGRPAPCAHAVWVPAWVRRALVADARERGGLSLAAVLREEASLALCAAQDTNDPIATAAAAYLSARAYDEGDDGSHDDIDQQGTAPVGATLP